LEWYKKIQGTEFKYTPCAIDWASGNGHVAILEWFKNSGYEFRYTSDAILWASRKAHVAILEWFKNSGYGI